MDGISFPNAWLQAIPLFGVGPMAAIFDTRDGNVNRFVRSVLRDEFHSAIIPAGL
jgi:hypothetical protein